MVMQAQPLLCFQLLLLKLGRAPILQPLTNRTILHEYVQACASLISEQFSTWNWW